MRRNLATGTTATLGLMMVMAAGGCTSSLKDENARLTDENQGLRQRLAERNTALDATQSELRERDETIARLRRPGGETDPYAPPAAGGLGEGMNHGATPTAFDGIEGVAGAFSPGLVTATVESDVLFDPGKSALKPSARAALDAVIRVLNATYAGKTIRVAGHTDTDPIRKSGYKSNYHLGFERAYAVRSYLVKKGVPADRVYLASHGPDQARSSKKASRRVEIAVVLQE